jgi:hypothetical protein
MCGRTGSADSQRAGRYRSSVVARYTFEDIAFTNGGDFVLDPDPLDNGSNVGWDFLTTTKFSRNIRRGEMAEDGSHPDKETGSLLDYYLEALRNVYPGVPDEILLQNVADWGYTLDDNCEAIRQIIRERIKTTNPDWLPYPLTGADLEVNIGEDMNIDMLDDTKARIHRALTYDNMVEEGRLAIKYYRGGQDLVFFVIDIILGEGKFIREVVPFSFTEGPYLMMKAVGI